jgi:hypothetical protein
MGMLVVTARWVLAGVFIAAAAPKILAPQEFAEAVFRYQLLPDALINLMGIYLPWIELWAGLALLFIPRVRDGAALILLGLLAVFTAAIAISMARGIDIACGCFSVDPKAGHVGALSLARNTGLMLLAVLILAVPRKRAAVSPPPSAGSAPAA